MRKNIIGFQAALALALLSGCSSQSAEDAAKERVAEGESHIIGGIIDNRRVYVVGVGDNNYAFCTGTLISRRTVLTAGHCFGGITRIYIGTNLTGFVQGVDVVQEVRHPKYDDFTPSYDLTILKLAEDAPVQPVPLLRETMNNTPTWLGPNFAFVGYGNDGQNNYDIRLVAVFPIEAVGPANVGGTPDQIDESMIYYKVPGKNTCDGDSGGPSFVSRGKVERVAGATSFGDADCTLDGVNARSDAPMIAEFIQPMIDQFEGNDPCRSDGVCSEACNVNNKLVDPDCAEKHCGGDGMCVISCVNPVDPDCKAGVACGEDNFCDRTCAVADVDCPPLDPDAGTGQGGDPGQGGAPGAGGAGMGGSPSMSAGNGGGGSDDDSDNKLNIRDDDGCGCRVPASDSNGGGKLAVFAAAAAIAAMRRRRR